MNIKHLIATLSAVTPLCLTTHAASPVWDTGAAPGIQAGSGTWDFNTTGNWTLDGGASRGPWASNADTALFQLQGGNGTVTVDNANGQVGAAGIAISGNTAANGTWTITGGALQIGSGGLLVNFGADSNTLSLGAPIVLTASQTWTSTTASASNSASRVLVGGAISSSAGTTNLTFDGGNRFNSSSVGGNNRVGFTLSGNNTFSGATTVTGGAQLVLNYTTTSDSRLDDSSALNLSGGTIVLNGGSNYVEVVGSTNVNAGHSNIITGPNGGGGTTNHIQLNAITHNTGGTLDISNAAADIARTTSGNTTGILGGYATVGGNRFATVNSGTIASTTGSTRNDYAAWVASDNGFVNTAVAGSGNRSLNSLRLASGGSVTLSSGTATIASGGIIGDGGSSFSGGALTSGLASGELFVHTPSALTIGSTIVDNGPTSLVLVKAGTNSLTLTGDNTYTGATYLNAGTLVVSGDATLRGSVIQAGATNLNVTSGGALSPGAAGVAGTMTLGGNLSLADGAELVFQLGTTSDLIQLTNGFASLSGSASAGGITLYLSDAGGVTTQTYTLMTWQAGTTLTSFDLSDFSVVTSGGISGSLQFGANSLEYVVSAIPEPTTAAMVLGMAAVTLVFRRRR